MKLLRSGLTAVALAVVAASGVQASPLFAIGGNELLYNNFETPYRLSSNCGVFVGDCLPFIAGQDPIDANGKKWQQVNGAIAGNLQTGDVFVGILSANAVKKGINGGSGTIWQPGIGKDIFSGYFVQQITNIDAASAFPSAYISLGTASIDPFGVLNTAAGVMFGLYANGTDTIVGNGSIVNAISQAVGLGGSALVAGGNASLLWANVGIGSNSALGSQGYSYTQTPFNLGSSSSLDQSFAHSALDIVGATGPTYSAGILRKLNDNVDNNAGGAIADTAQLLCSTSDIAASTTFVPGTPASGAGLSGVACTDLIVSTRIDPNGSFVAADNTGSDLNSYFQFTSFDPVKLNRVPEPGSLALMGIALAGLGAARRRKSV